MDRWAGAEGVIHQSQKTPWTATDHTRAGQRKPPSVRAGNLRYFLAFLLESDSRMAAMAHWQRLLLLAVFIAAPARGWAGPPYVSDDAEPTDYGHYEIYLFTQGVAARGDANGASGLDFNYGATPDLQLTAVFPIAYDDPRGESAATGLGNIELAAKYRFLHQADIGWDVAIFPRLFLPSPQAHVGETHFSLLIPIWLEKDWGQWSVFGGGGCVIDRGGDSRDYCLAGWALARQVMPDLQLGVEIVHQSAPTRGSRAMTAAGAGMKYDFGDNYHLLAYWGPGLQNAAETGRYSWYASVLFTF
jgi:Putative MetA-pathway of phenol degradation